MRKGCCGALEGINSLLCANSLEPLWIRCGPQDDQRFYVRRLVKGCQGSVLNFRYAIKVAPSSAFTKEPARGVEFCKMNTNLKILALACQQTHLPYRTLHPSGNLLEVRIHNKPFLFLNWATPLNDQTTTQLCKDKEYFYRAAKDYVQMPKTVGYLNPDCEEQYQKYLEQHSILEIAADILKNFTLPVVIKKNRGSLGVNVFKCSSESAIVQALERIFDPHSKNFDYVALAQAYIPIVREFRILFLEGEYQFGYQKNVEGASFGGNLSPLHWDGATAVLLEEKADSAMIERIQDFCQPLYNHLGLRYTGLDVALDAQNQLWLIEANASPGFDYIVRDGGEKRVLELYLSILKCLGAEI